ncbi:hypothetical protein P167DRAFT_607496 [Morchella conica CCBAS932]|uniref:Uncharacterized protein n=1 Tax=Morchella conica CCBAS932 TaxID=1392247 RepID=A0A3N4KW16_9PEZI|nr:hypothetical protein P167DRAFT_607496 [Morchella conica CCBAS932]
MLQIKGCMFFVGRDPAAPFATSPIPQTSVNALRTAYTGKPAPEYRTGGGYLFGDLHLPVTVGNEAAKPPSSALRMQKEAKGVPVAPQVPIATQESTAAPEAKNLTHSRWAKKEPISLPLGHAVATPSAECTSATPEPQAGLLKSVSNTAVSSGISPLAPSANVKKSSNTHKKKNKKKNNACQNSNQEKPPTHVHTENVKDNKDIVTNAQPHLDWSEEPEVQGPATQTNFVGLGPNTLGGRAFPAQGNQTNQQKLTVLERLQSMAHVGPGAFLRPRPRFYGFQCFRTLGTIGLYGCMHGPNCFYGHEGDVYTDSTYKSNHYVNRWHTEITEAEKTKLKSMMTWRDNKIKARNLLQNPTFRAEPRVRASDLAVPSHQTHHNPQEFSIKSKKQKKRPQNHDGALEANEHTPPHHQNSDFQPNDQTQHHQNPPLQKSEHIHNTEQSHYPQDFSLQKNQISHHGQVFVPQFQNYNQIYPRHHFDFQHWHSRPQNVSFYNGAHQMDPMANGFTPFAMQFNIAQDYNVHQNFQTQPQLAYNQGYYDGDIGSQYQPSDTGAYDIPQSQGCIPVPGDMNTKNMERVPRINTEDLVYNWQQNIPSALIPADDPKSSPTDGVRPVNSFTLRPEVSAFVPEAKKQWPGLDKGQYPGHPFDSTGTLIPGVTSPGFLIWTSAGYGYYGNNGVWYPYREPTDDGSEDQKDVRRNKNQDSSERSSAGQSREV